MIGAAAAAACLLFFDFGVAVLQEPEEIFFHWFVVVLAWVIGSLVNRAERRAADAHRRAVDIEAESRTRMLGAIAEERTRIARELHDIVAHSVSPMVVQAGAAEQVVEDDPAYTRSALASHPRNRSGRAQRDAARGLRCSGTRTVPRDLASIHSLRGVGLRGRFLSGSRPSARP